MGQVDRKKKKKPIGGQSIILHEKGRGRVLVGGKEKRPRSAQNKNAQKSLFMGKKVKRRAKSFAWSNNGVKKETSGGGEKADFGGKSWRVPKGQRKHTPSAQTRQRGDRAGEEERNLGLG